MVIDGEKYRRDLVIFPDRVKPNWWREQGHSLALGDIQDILDESPAVLVVGTGYFGIVNVPSEVREYIESRGIEFIAQKTAEAVGTYNRLVKDGKKVVGAFHLTC